jgi:hypothetical protein
LYTNPLNIPADRRIPTLETTLSNQDTDRLDLIDVAAKKFAHGRFDHDRGLIDAEYLLLAVLAHDADPGCSLRIAH